MARTKQATPLRRNPSSEYTVKQDKATRTTEKALEPITNGSIAEGVHLEKFAPEQQRKDAGIIQFLIAVGGIYGSL